MNSAQGKNIVWQRLSEIKGTSVMCLDCRLVAENRRDEKNHHPTDIVQHLNLKKHNRVQILENSNKTKIKVVQCFNCLLGDVFKLRIYQLSGETFILCDDCAQDSTTVLRSQKHTYSSFYSLNYDRVIVNHSINSMLVKLQEDNRLASSNKGNFISAIQVEQQNMMKQSTESQKKSEKKVQQPNNIVNSNKPKETNNQTKKKQKSDKNQQLIGSDKVLKQIQIGSKKVQKENQTIKCLDCKQRFSNEKSTPGKQKSSIIQHLTSKVHNRIELFSEREEKYRFIPSCCKCGKRNIFDLSICFVNQEKFILCSHCFQANNCSILTNNLNLSSHQISQFPSEPLVINFSINALVLNQKYHLHQLKTSSNFINKKQIPTTSTKKEEEKDKVEGESNSTLVDSSVECLNCHNYFQNERKKRGAPTNIVKHLKRCNHFKIQISPNAAKTDLQKFRCVNCQEENIFILHLVDVSSFYITLCKQCISTRLLRIKGQQEELIQLKNCRLTPIIFNGAINSLLMNLTVKKADQDQQKLASKNNQKEMPQPQNEMKGNNDDDCEEELIFDANDLEEEEEDFEFLDLSDDQKESQDLHKIPCEFMNYTDYKSFFQSLLGVETNSLKKQTDKISFVTDVNFTSNQEVTLNCSSVTNQLKIGSELLLKQSAFTEQCTVKSLVNDRIVATIQNQTIQENKHKVVKNVKVKSLFPKIIFDRINCGLNKFSKVDKTLQSVILGLISPDNDYDSNSTDSLEIVDEQRKREFNQLNKSQLAAIEQASDCTVSLIQGPPGTGKTETIAHFVARLCENSENSENSLSQKQNKILVCAPSNLAADNIASRIHEINQKIRVYRVVSQSRQRVQKDYEYPNIILHCLVNKQNVSNKVFKEQARLLLDDAQVICTTCINSIDSFILQDTFETVIIDEANQAIEPESIIPLQLKAKQLILVGDHKQLPPIVSSTVAARNGLKRSLFTRLIQLGHKPSFLSYQYRMHPAISSLVSSVFYENKLIDAVFETDRLPNPNFMWRNRKIPIQFYNVEGQESTLSDGKSFLNECEALQVVELISQLKAAGVKEEDIGVITPYCSQANLIKSKLGDSNILIDTVYSYQGKENEYIIFSCVRINSFNSLGILRSPQIINVAISRAKRGLLIVGNREHLNQSKWWNKVLDYLQSHQLFMDVSISDLPTSIERIQEEKEVLSVLDNRFLFFEQLQRKQ